MLGVKSHYEKDARAHGQGIDDNGGDGGRVGDEGKGGTADKTDAVAPMEATATACSRFSKNRITKTTAVAREEALIEVVEPQSVKAAAYAAESSSYRVPGIKRHEFAFFTPSLDYNAS